MLNSHLQAQEVLIKYFMFIRPQIELLKLVYLENNRATENISWIEKNFIWKNRNIWHDKWHETIQISFVKSCKKQKQLREKRNATISATS